MPVGDGQGLPRVDAHDVVEERPGSHGSSLPVAVDEHDVGQRHASLFSSAVDRIFQRRSLFARDPAVEHPVLLVPPSALLVVELRVLEDHGHEQELVPPQADRVLASQVEIHHALANELPPRQARHSPPPGGHLLGDPRANRARFIVCAMHDAMVQQPTREDHVLRVRGLRAAPTHLDDVLGVDTLEPLLRQRLVQGLDLRAGHGVRVRDLLQLLPVLAVLEDLVEVRTLGTTKEVSAVASDRCRRDLRKPALPPDNLVRPLRQDRDPAPHFYREFVVHPLLDLLERLPILIGNSSDCRRAAGSPQLVATRRS